MLEDLPICKPGTPTLDGSNSSDGMKKRDNSTMFTTIRLLMSMEEEMKKVTMFKYTRQMEVQPKNGN